MLGGFYLSGSFFKKSNYQSEKALAFLTVLAYKKRKGAVI